MSRTVSIAESKEIVSLSLPTGQTATKAKPKATTKLVERTKRKAKPNVYTWEVKGGQEGKVGYSH
jgi:hypothetical protein